MTPQKSNIPALRFPEFKGEWERINFDDVFIIKAGGDIQKENVSDTKTERFCYPIYANSENNKGLYGYSDIYIIDKSCVTVSGRGNLGRAYARDHKFYPIVRLLILFPKVKSDVRFYENAINIINFFVESTGVPQLTAPQLSSYKIGTTFFDEQKKIADFLTAVDQKIAQLTEKKTCLEQYKKGVMQRLFTQRLRFHDTNGNPFPDWEEGKLGDIANITTGDSNREDSNLSGEYTFFDRSQDIRSSDRYLFDGEAIIVAGEGQEFCPKHFIGKFDLHQRTYAIMNFPKAHGKYLFYYTLTP